MTPFRLAFIAGPLGRGGAEQQLYYLLQGLDRDRWAPTVIQVSDRVDEYWVEPIRALGIPVEHVGRSAMRLERVRKIARLLRSQDADIVHSTLLYLNPYAAAAGRLAGTTVRIGGICEDATGVPGLKSPVWLGYYGCDILVANFRGALRNVPARVRAAQRVVYSGIPVTPLPSEQERRDIRAALGCGDGPIVGAVGRIDQNKNFHMLIQAFAGIAQRQPDATLVIVGDGPARPELERLTDALGLSGRVLFPGRVPGSAQTAIFPGFDVACLSSISEGFPIALLEASMAAVPVVTTICGGTPEMVREAETGFLVANGDEEAMAARIEQLLADRAAARVMGSAAREHVIAHFDVPRMVDATADVYDEALRTRRPS